MESSLQKLSAQERGVSSSGETLAQTEQALRDLESLESKAQVGPQTFHPNMFQKVPGCVSNRWSEILPNRVVLTDLPLSQAVSWFNPNLNGRGVICR